MSVDIFGKRAHASFAGGSLPEQEVAVLRYGVRCRGP